MVDGIPNNNIGAAGKVGKTSAPKSNKAGGVSAISERASSTVAGLPPSAQTARAILESVGGRS